MIKKKKIKKNKLKKNQFKKENKIHEYKEKKEKTSLFNLSGNYT